MSSGSLITAVFLRPPGEVEAHSHTGFLGSVEPENDLVAEEFLRSSEDARESSLTA